MESRCHGWKERTLRKAMRTAIFLKGASVNIRRWYTVGNEELQAGSYAEAVRIIRRRKAFRMWGNEFSLYKVWKKKMQRGNSIEKG